MAKTKRKSRARQKPSPPEWNGDHGPRTSAALADTYLEPITSDDGSNPNKMARRRRKDALSGFSLSMRQEQAGRKIQDAYARNEMLSSGSPLKEQVDASPKPDATIAAQVDARSMLVFVMSAVPRDFRQLVEHVCWFNQPLATFNGKLTDGGHTACFKIALDLVANKLRY